MSSTTTEPVEPTSDDLADAIETAVQVQLDEAKASALLAQLSPLDQSLRRPNARQQHGRPTVWNVFDVMVTPSMAFDPAQVTTLPEYEELEGYGVQLAVDALKTLHATTSRLLEARETLKANPVRHEAELALELDDLHSKLMPVATDKIDAANKKLSSAIAVQEAELKQPITEGARGPFAAEVRAYARGLNASERLRFFNAAISNGDMAALGACLGAPSYLSGLDPKMAVVLTEQANRARSPLVVKRLALLKGAQTKLETAGSLFVSSTEKIVGVSEGVIFKLRAQRARVRKVTAHA